MKGFQPKKYFILIGNDYIRGLHQTKYSKTYEGRDTKTPTGIRKCFIKQLEIDSYTPQQQQELKKRFKKEAEILEKLGKHEQIPDLYAYFYEENQLYLVQEWIEGSNFL